jgi:DNA-binding CsgD family transcriptional regulator
VAIVRDEQRRPLYFVAQMTDITDRKRAEQESARRLRQFERLTRTVSRILRTFDCEDGDSVYPAVLATLLETCQSDSGVFLRLSDPQALVGSFVSPNRRQEVRYALPIWNELWQQALHAGVVIVDNQTHWTVCDTVLERSLVAPLHYDGTPLGVMHLGNSPHDYDDDDRDLISHVSDLIAPALRARLRREQLTPREAEVMDLIVAGKTQKQIAAELNITVQTAAKHRSRVLQKLSVSNDVELVHLAQHMKPAWPVAPDPQPPGGDGSS